MVDMLSYQAPLYGQFTGQLPLGPLSYAALLDFFPTYSAAERVARGMPFWVVSAAAGAFLIHRDRVSSTIFGLIFSDRWACSAGTDGLDQ